MIRKPPKPERSAELNDLRARLTEAEDVLRAIRSGDVDAVVVTGGRGEQVYTLAGADRAYRQLIETMSEGAMTVSAGGVILYCNVRSAEMLGRPIDHVRGSALRQYLSSDDQPVLDAVLAQSGARTSRREVSLKAPDGRVMPVYLSASRLPSEGVEPVFCLVLTDLTDKKSHEQMVADERLARLMLEQTAEAIIVCNEQGHVVRLSTAAVGLCDGNPLHRDFSDAFPLRSTDGSAFDLTSVLRGERFRNVDAVLERQGRMVEFTVNAGPLRIGRQIRGCVVSVTDVTERHRTEAALRDSERFNRGLVEHLPQRIFVKDLRSVYRFASANFASDLGIAANQIVGKDDFAFFPADLADRYRADDRAVMGDGKIRHIDERYLNGGVNRWIHTIKVPYRDDRGEISGVLGIFEDTTERRSADEQRERLAALVEASPDFIGFADPKTMHVSYINRRGRAMCGLGEDEDVRQLSINDLYPASMRKLLLEEVVPAIERDGQWTGDGALLHRDGREIPVSMAMLGRKASNGEVDLYYTVSRDITERVRAEEVLEHRAAELRESQRIARVGSWERTLATNAMEWSDGLNRILGRDQGSAAPTFENLPRFYTPESWRRLRAAIAVAIETGEPYDLELEQIRADGTRCWTITRGEPVRDAYGTVVKLRGTVLDSTEHKRAEEARRHRAAELEESQRIARIGSWEWIIAGGVISWSDGMNHLLARDRSLPPPTFETLAQFYTPESWQRLGAVIGRAVETGVSYDIDVEMVRADGTTCWTTTRGEAVRGDDGTVAKLRGTVLDISERKRAEGTLHMQGSALNAAANPIVITDAQGTITWANAAFSVTSGYDLSETIGRNLRTLVKSGVQGAEFYRQMWETILAGQVWQGELTNRRKDGSRYPETMTITPVKDASGTISHFIAVKRDLTNERKLQAEFHQAQKMESVGRLAGGVAHDFNNLLTVILSYAKFIEEELAPNDARRDDLQQILSAGESAAELTGRLLAFSRKEVLEPRILLLNTVVSTAEGMLRRLIREDIGFRMVLAPDLRPIFADRGQMEQVIMNLAVNARDAMSDGGTLTIETENVPADAVPSGGTDGTTSGDYVLLRVRDTGVGMDEATRQHVFEPFFTTKEWGKGTGLGLSTVHGIVRTSGGFIRLQSEPGVGTTFSIYLPAVSPTGRPDQLPRTGPTEVRGTETVLVVEDAAAIRTAVCTVLQRNGYTVLVASDGFAALERAAEYHGPIHLLLTDVVMPRMNGRQLADQLRELRPELRVLYMSGYTHDMISEHGILGTGAALLHKPFTPGPLAIKVREVLDAS